MAPIRLAQEVIDSIIDYLHGDVKSLSNCALVSRSWTPRAQHNIFAEVTLPFRSDGIPTARFTRIQGIVQQHPEIALMPRRVCIVASEEAADRVIIGLDSFAPQWDASYASSAVRLFPNIRQVAVMDLACQSLPDLAESIVAAIPAVVALSFDSVHFSDAHPEPVWTPPQNPVTLTVNEAVEHRPASLRKLTIRNLQARHGVAQCESFALAESLARRGELSSLVSLELLSGPGVTQTWLPFLPSIGRQLQHCAIAINDVVRDNVGFYRNLTIEHLREKIIEFYNALLACPNLRSLGIKYDGVPSYAEGLADAYEDPAITPQISPFFLQALSTLLSRAEVPFPELETLAFDIFSTVEGLALCGDAWTALRDILCARERYPRFRHLRVELEEMGSGYGPWRELKAVRSRNADARAGLLRAQLRMFEESGITVSVATRDSQYWMM
ncbi:hypothetical protein K466DRAFT_567034 [Polyporus arcularius HHB13444]|uniref:F-box domain-containing protein n=1 Tax=Polyporus arcularius HHB13444 TaxID=1314778 RepID=A0A5C3P719_9APHY|nr:hypothetical protein K466DRAFT_567034 [Polyporus arcularius HHB13444]